MLPRMEPSFTPPSLHQQNLVLGWTPAPADAVAVPSQSASSAIISPGIRDSAESPCDSLGQRNTSLKEHDYIGLAEVSSVPPPSHEPINGDELTLTETDLRLGLGPSMGPSQDEESKVSGAASASHSTHVTLHGLDDARLPPSVSRMWASISSKSLADAVAMPHVKGYQSLAQLVSCKNGSKRLYSGAMVDAPRNSRLMAHANSTAGVFNPSEPKSCANPMASLKQAHIGAESYLEGLFWVSPQVALSQSQNEPMSGTHHTITSQKGLGFLSAVGEENGEVPRNPKLDLNICSDGSKLQPHDSVENVLDEAPPAKGRVVGWPPVRAYRRGTFGNQSKLNGDGVGSPANVYVKVNMDGIPIGRKVDLSAYKSYDGLLSALEDMFHNPNGGHGTQFLKGSEFVLTYEDKEGDWMLVGDVPWSMFINTVRRLRITRGHEMAGLGPRTSMRHA